MKSHLLHTIRIILNEQSIDYAPLFVLKTPSSADPNGDDACWREDLQPLENIAHRNPTCPSLLREVRNNPAQEDLDDARLACSATGV